MNKKDIFIGCFNKSVILTYIGVMFSIFGVFNLLIYNPTESINRIDVSILCLIISGICDLFDGVIARKCNRNHIQKQFGIQIDSFVDIISFLILPSVILYKICNQIPFIIIFIISCFYIICGITRLSWFNINTNEKTDYFQGLPVTYISLILPLLYSIYFKIFDNDFYLNIILPIIYIFVSFLFILNIKIKKPKGLLYFIFSVLAIITINLILF